jgi:hypothetical protein
MQVLPVQSKRLYECTFAIYQYAFCYDCHHCRIFFFKRQISKLEAALLHCYVSFKAYTRTAIVSADRLFQEPRILCVPRETSRVSGAG